MPNLYVTLDEMRDNAPNALRETNFDYDQRLVQMADAISRLIDGYCNRVFYPTLATRYFNGNGLSSFYIPDLVSVTSISYSLDDGTNYTALSTSDYILRSGKNNSPTSTYNNIMLTVNGTLGSWPRGQRSIKVVGVFGYNDDRANAFEDSQDTVQNTTQISASGTTLEVSSIIGLNKWGQRPRFSVGNIIRMESEYAEIVVRNQDSDQATLVRAVNGTTGATHANGTQIDIWRVPAAVKEAAVTQVMHQFGRSQSNYADAEARPDLGRMMYVKGLDPSATAILERAGMVAQPLPYDEGF